MDIFQVVVAVLDRGTTGMGGKRRFALAAQLGQVHVFITVVNPSCFVSRIIFLPIPPCKVSLSFRRACQICELRSCWRGSTEQVYTECAREQELEKKQKNSAPSATELCFKYSSPVVSSALPVLRSCH